MSVSGTPALPVMLRQLMRAYGYEQVAKSATEAGFDGDLCAAILNEAAKFAAGELQPLNARIDREGCAFADGRVSMPAAFVETWARFREGGWCGIDIAVSQGGMGLPQLLSVAVQALFDTACLSFGMAPGAARAAARLIESHADADTANRWLPRLANGEWLASICMSEADAGSDVGRARTSGYKDASGVWRVTGEKMWISFGDHDLSERIGHIVLARTTPEPGVRGLSLFLVETGHAAEARNGVIVRRVEEKLGLHGSPTCAIGFEDARGTLIGEEGRGVAILFRMIVAMRLQVGTQGLGIASAACEAAVAYARDRRQGGPPAARAPAIIEHADIRRMLSAMRARVETLRGLVYAAGAAADLADSSTEASALLGWLLPIVKDSAAAIGSETANQAMLVLGGAGYTTEWPVEQYLRDVRILAIYEGTTGMQAIDLVKRRLAGGRPSYHAFQAIAQSDGARLPGPEATMFGAIQQSLAQAVAWLDERGRTSEEIDAAAVPILSLAIAASHAWIAARLVADRDETPEGRFLAACGQHELSRLADECPALLASVSGSALAVRDLADAILV